jgi:transcriptional regulator of acetoin/glycerol metabolism
MEKAHITAILRREQWNISQSAEILQIDRATLYNKIRKYDLQREETDDVPADETKKK